MKRFRIVLVVFAVAAATGGIVFAQVPPADNIPNWSVPATWSPARASGGIQTMTDISDGIPFVAVAPCRIADTRAINGFAGQAGGPIIPSNTTRVFQISGSPTTVPAPPNGCAPGTIPAGADAVSFQFTIVSPSADGNLIAWNGGTIPQVSVLNWPAGTVALGNGTIVPISSIGQLSVRLNMAVGQSAHLVIDVNGYFGDTLNTGTGFELAYSRTSALMNVDNLSTACNTAGGLDACAITASASGPGNAIYAVAGSTGATYGVIAFTNSTANNSAGVRGEGAATTCGQPGLRTGILGAGGPDATAEVPVVGIGDYEGVRGINTSGCTSTVASMGSLGWDDGTALYGQGALSVTGTKSFVDPHPTDPSKVISYVSLEGPEAGTYFRGKGRFQNGIAVIEPPESFRLVTATEGLSIQVTPIGQMATVAVQSIGLDRIVVRGSRNVEFFYTVNGVRATFANFEPIQENKYFSPQSKDWVMPTSLSPEQRKRLIQSGAYGEDGKVNAETAKALGWDKKFEEPAAIDASQEKKGRN